VAEVPCPLQAMAAARPDEPAIVAPHQIFTYREYDRLAGVGAQHLRQVGLGEGGVLGIALPPGSVYPVLLYAAMRSGLVACPLNTRFPIQYILDTLRRIGCRTLVTPYGPSATTVQGRLYSLTPRDIVERPPRRDEVAGPCTILLEGPATIVLTSGSSGAPKAALHAYGNHWASAQRANANMPLTPGDRWLLSLPLYHVAGLGVVFRCLAAGAAVVIPGANEGVAESVYKYQVTHLSLVATQLHRLMQQPGSLNLLRGLKAILLGGSAIPEGLLRRAQAEGLPIYTSYGLTETAAQITATAPGDGVERLLSSGRPLAEDTVRINSEGLIEVSGDSLFMGYVSEKGLEKPFTGDGWFTTGDRGAWDEEGYLKVLGRRDNMFISGGENIQPEEIEEALCKHPDVLRAVVTPAPHPEFVQCPVAFVSLRGAAPLDEAALGASLRAQLPPYKIPKRFYPWPEEMAPVDEKIKRAPFIELAARLAREG